MPLAGGARREATPKGVTMRETEISSGRVRAADRHGRRRGAGRPPEEFRKSSGRVSGGSFPVDNVSLTVRRGEVLTLLGPSGSFSADRFPVAGHWRGDS